MPKGVNSGYSVGPSAEGTIRSIHLRKIPATKDSAFTVAHEIGHALLDEEGFPATKSEDPYSHICAALNSMVSDPLVNARLQRYGFDLRPPYDTETAETKRQIQSGARLLRDRFTELSLMIAYAANVLDWELIGLVGERNQFQEWFDSRHRRIARKGQKLLGIVRRTGFDTPEKMYRFFQEVIGRYNLSQFLAVDFWKEEAG